MIHFLLGPYSLYLIHFFIWPFSWVAVILSNSRLNQIKVIDTQIWRGSIIAWLFGCLVGCRHTGDSSDVTLTFKDAQVIQLWGTLTVSGLPLDYLWTLSGLSMDCLWNVSKMSLKCLWTVSGLSLDCLWSVSGLSMDWPTDFLILRHVIYSCVVFNWLGYFKLLEMDAYTFCLLNRATTHGTVVLGPIWTKLLPNLKLIFFFKNSLKWSTWGF